MEKSPSKQSSARTSIDYPMASATVTTGRAKNLCLYRGARRQIHMDFHTPDDAPGFLSDFSPDEIARTLRDARVQGVKIFAKCACGNSYYFTKVGRRHPQLGRDFLRELGSSLQTHGIFCCAHYAVLHNWAAARDHPDWCVRREDGSSVAESLCPNSPYIREIVLPQLEELCAYPINGFFLDIVYFPSDVTGCLCDYCRRAFRAEGGLELTGDLFRRDPEVVSSFRYRSLHKMLAMCREVRDRFAPEKIILANQAHVVCPGEFNYEGETAHVADVGVAESQPGGATMYHGASHYGRLLRRKNVPFEIIPVRFMYGWGEGMLKPLAQMNYENALIAANGGVVSLGDHLAPSGRLDAKVYERIGRSYEFLHEREPFLCDTTAVRYAAVMQRADSAYWNRAAMGAERLLDEAHVQTDVLDVSTLDRLDDYRVLFLPDRRDNPKENTQRKDAFIFPIPRLIESQIRRIADWVAAGGRLIVCGNAIVSEGPADLVEKLLGVRVGDVSETSGYLYGTGPSVPSCYDGYPLQVRSPFYHTEPTTARAVLGWCKPLVFSRTDCSAGAKRLAGEKASTGAVFVNQFGRGAVLYFAFPICLDYAQTRNPWLSEMFRHLTTDLLSDRPVVIKGIPSLHANLRQGKDGVKYLDLVFAHTEPAVMLFPEAGLADYPSVHEEYPLSNVRIFIRDVHPRNVTLEPGGRPLSWQQEKEGVFLIVPEVRTYDIVRMESSPQKS